MLYFSLAVIQIIFFEAHFLLYRTVRDIFGISGESLFILKIIAVTFSLSFIVASILSHLFCNKLTKAIYSAAGVWLGFLIYFLLAAAAYWIVFFAFGKFMPAQAVTDAGECFFAAATVVGIYGLVNARNIRIKNIAVEIKNLPPSWVNRKAVLVSDIHIGQVRGEAFARKITDAINALSPDIVFFAGDMFDGVKVDAEKDISPFSNIQAPLGKFFVIGNHEEFQKRSTEEFVEAVRKTGVTVLDNRLETVDGVEIIGVTDSDATKKKIYETVLNGLTAHQKTRPRILLKHTPVSTIIAEKALVDLELSGHTHAGQVFPFTTLTSLLFKKRTYGLSTFREMTVYTSSGVGTAITPMRIGSNPEIVVISFRNKS